MQGTSMDSRRSGEVPLGDQTLPERLQGTVQEVAHWDCEGLVGLCLLTLLVPFVKRARKLLVGCCFMSTSPPVSVWQRSLLPVSRS